MNILGLVLLAAVLVVPASPRREHPPNDKKDLVHFLITMKVFEVTAQGGEKCVGEPCLGVLAGRSGKFVSAHDVRVGKDETQPVGISISVNVLTDLGHGKGKLDVTAVQSESEPTGKDGVTIFARTLRTVREIEFGKTTKIVWPDGKNCAELTVEKVLHYQDSPPAVLRPRLGSDAQHFAEKADP